MAKLVHLKDIKPQPNTVVTVGTFDGVHEGHRALMETVVAKAKKRGARSVVVTFDPHPRTIINPKGSSIRLLTSLKERAEILEDIGVDELCVIPFTRDFSLLSSEEFVRDVIHSKIGISEFVIGYDHHFGKDRSGTIETLENLGPELGFDVYVVSKREKEEITISSTVIRKAIQEEGDMTQASKLLGRPYMLNGLVIHGDERGRKIGFPTANLQAEHPDKVIPKNGIYAVKVRVDGVWYNGMMNIGVRPTFDGETKTLEVNIFDFDQSIYGKTVQIRFFDRIRDEQKFNGIQELKDQLGGDKKKSIQVLS
ncbi:MAG: bifunctional riboflavin kinase/FAD synthetase [Balneolaceae bacterium]|nr:bifunctional riboflavin kinase/FAD synthetase [Balneolaceae bacterium]MBO6546489.1 bifunctional riboflavin kinase/FAD synthetase [Balneolaceae bacterium]MBO6648848.1 bifunctional riboflavin kinase/FAD synthetase [Balneolaceae bacterium]